MSELEIMLINHVYRSDRKQEEERGDEYDV